MDFLRTFSLCFGELKKYCDKCAFLCSFIFASQEILRLQPLAVFKFHNYSTHWFDRVSSVVSHSSYIFIETHQLLHSHSSQIVIVTVEELYYKYLCGKSNNKYDGVKRFHELHNRRRRFHCDSVQSPQSA